MRAAPVPERWPPVTVAVCTAGGRPEMLAKAVASFVGQDYPGVVTTLVVFDRVPPDPALASDDPRRPVAVLANTRTPGVSGARNTGILAARTDLVALADDDVVWRPGKLRAQVAALLARPDALVVTCGLLIIRDGFTEERRWAKPENTFEDLLRTPGNGAFPFTFLLRREAVLRTCGLFAEDIPGGYGEDYDFMLRAARHAPALHVPEILVDVPEHGVSHFAGRWGLIAQATEWLVAHHPEFLARARTRAHMSGYIAFAHAMAGRRGTALRWTWRALRANPLEKRGYHALLAVAGILRPATFGRLFLAWRRLLSWVRRPVAR